jgi:hypothetical protein
MLLEQRQNKAVQPSGVLLDVLFSNAGFILLDGSRRDY